MAYLNHDVVIFQTSVGRGSHNKHMRRIITTVVMLYINLSEPSGRQTVITVFDIFLAIKLSINVHNKQFIHYWVGTCAAV